MCPVTRLELTGATAESLSIPALGLEMVGPPGQEDSIPGTSALFNSPTASHMLVICICETSECFVQAASPRKRYSFWPLV
jgi:hypothetical protein